jgi:hypothetical protein
MAASIPIEQQSGMAVGRVHPHNGYYAGDFTSARHAPPAPGTDPRPPPLSVTGERVYESPPFPLTRRGDSPETIGWVRETVGGRPDGVVNATRREPHRFPCGRRVR